MDEKSLSHTSWNCKYRIVLVPKYRRKVIYGKLRKDIGKILRTLCDYKHVEIIEAHAMPDHIHMLVSIPPKPFQLILLLDGVDQLALTLRQCILYLFGIFPSSQLFRVFAHDTAFWRGELF